MVSLACTREGGVLHARVKGLGALVRMNGRGIVRSAVDPGRGAILDRFMPELMRASPAGGGMREDAGKRPDLIRLIVRISRPQAAGSSGRQCRSREGAERCGAGTAKMRARERAGCANSQGRRRVETPGAKCAARSRCHTIALPLVTDKQRGRRGRRVAAALPSRLHRAARLRYHLAQGAPRFRVATRLRRPLATDKNRGRRAGRVAAAPLSCLPRSARLRRG